MDGTTLDIAFLHDTAGTVTFSHSGRYLVAITTRSTGTNTSSILPGPEPGKAELVDLVLWRDTIPASYLSIVSTDVLSGLFVIDITVDGGGVAMGVSNSFVGTCSGDILISQISSGLSTEEPLRHLSALGLDALLNKKFAELMERQTNDKLPPSAQPANLDLWDRINSDREEKSAECKREADSFSFEFIGWRPFAGQGLLLDPISGAIGLTEQMTLGRLEGAMRSSDLTEFEFASLVQVRDRNTLAINSLLTPGTYVRGSRVSPDIFVRTNEFPKFGNSSSPLK